MASQPPLPPVKPPEPTEPHTETSNPPKVTSPIIPEPPNDQINDTESVPPQNQISATKPTQPKPNTATTPVPQSFSFPVSIPERIPTRPL